MRIGITYSGSGGFLIGKCFDICYIEYPYCLHKSAIVCLSVCTLLTESCNSVNKASTLSCTAGLHLYFRLLKTSGKYCFKPSSSASIPFSNTLTSLNMKSRLITVAVFITKQEILCLTVKEKFLEEAVG